jgi:hypothetical protein
VRLSSVLCVALITPGRAGEHHPVVDYAEDLNDAVRTDPIQYKMSWLRNTMPSID